MTNITDNFCLANFHNVDVTINLALEKGAKTVHFPRINIAKKKKKTISDKTVAEKSFTRLVFRTSKNPSPHISFATQRFP